MNKFFIACVIISLMIIGGAMLYSAPAEQMISEDKNTDANGTSTPETASSTTPQHKSIAYHGTTTGYVAYPAGGAEKRPAIILIHEWWGLNDDIKSLADSFAEKGYVALAVDLYDGAIATDQNAARELAGAVRADTERAFANLRSAVSYLKSRPDVEGEKLASVGWCFGGGWSYQMAKNDLGTKASIMYYGQFDPEDDFTHMRASILGHFGEADASIKVDTVREFQAKLATARGAHEVYIYPNAGHGFANSRGGENAGYNAEAADLAWTRTITFLENALKTITFLENALK